MSNVDRTCSGRRAARGRASSFRAIPLSLTIAARFLVACLSGCQPSPRIESTEIAKVNHDSPKAIIDSFQEALSNADHLAMVECMAPEGRKGFQEVLFASKSYTDKVVAVARLVERHIGKKEAALFRKNVYMGMLTSPLGDAARGSDVHWSKISITISGGKATVVAADDRARNFTLVKRDAKWYLAPSYYLDGLPSEGVFWYEKTFNEFGRQMDSLHQMIEEGTLNRSNFSKVVLSGKN